MEMMFETLIVERDPELPGLMTVTLNRPEKLNAINRRMHRELQQLCAELQEDTLTRVVIFTGAGRAFCPGNDRTEGYPPITESVLAERHATAAGNRTCAALEGLGQVTIGAINGLAVGGGLMLASCFDIRIAARSAWFSIPETGLGHPLGWNTLPRLLREIGPARTKEMLMTTARISSVQACRWGFVNHVVRDHELLGKARALAEQMLATDPWALAVLKTATSALAQLMVPPQATYADPDIALLGRRNHDLRRDAEMHSPS